MAPLPYAELEALGLSEKEAVVYPALLKLELATVKDLVEETGLNRSSLYVVLERLMKRGLVSVAGARGVRKYAAVAPDRLAHIAKERLEESVLTLQAFETLLPEIRAFEKTSRHKPRMRIFSGAKGMRLAFEDSLNNSEKVMRVCSSAGKIAQSLPDYLPTYLRERFKRGISMHGIHTDDEMGREMVRHIPQTIDQLTFLPEERFRFPSDLGIYMNKVAFMAHESLLCVVIESEAIARVMKAVFDLAQREAQRIGRDPYATAHE